MSVRTVLACHSRVLSRALVEGVRERLELEESASQSQVPLRSPESGNHILDAPMGVVLKETELQQWVARGQLG